MLGICNGFQALIKTGSVPYGKITDTQETEPDAYLQQHWPTRLLYGYTRVTSVKSPWLAGTEAGEVFATPVSHGEGRFVADEETLSRLIANGQVATQYVDLEAGPQGISALTPMALSVRSRRHKPRWPRVRQDGAH